jgi:alkyl sulfatase BDS1-like metallo-beta-lactamase superfamily hydrolase
MGSLPENTHSRSRWLVAAMLAFHDPTAEVDRPTTWALTLTDGTFGVHAEASRVTVRAGTPVQPDASLTVRDDVLYRLLTRQISADDVVSDGSVVIEGDAAALPNLLSLFVFPPMAAGALDPE